MSKKTSPKNPAQILIERLVKEKKMSVADIADKVGSVNAQTVYRWRIGKQRPHNSFEKKLEELAR